MTSKRLIVATAVASALLASCANRDYGADYGNIAVHEEAASGHHVHQRTDAAPAHPVQPTPQQSRFHGRDASNDMVPPDPRPGECYSKVLIPEQYRTITDRVVVQEASERVEVIPAQYETVSERVLVKEASTELQVVPARYETVSEQVMVKPETVTFTEVPAVYRTETERVLDVPAHTEWKRATGRGFGSDGNRSYGGAAAQQERFEGQRVLDTRVEGSGEVMCLVEVPATYKTVERRVVVTPATTRRVVEPAEFRTVQRRVVVQPATTREVVIPAEYDTITATREVRPAQERRIPVAAEFDTVTRRELVAPSRVEWRPVLCEVNMTRQNVRSLQLALQREGCYQCQVDGVMGPCTIRASQCYARRNGLSSGETYITLEVIRSLGLDLRASDEGR